MVKAFHQAGIEGILAVVYNHTAEAGPLGPTLSFRGLDDRGFYYRTGEESAGGPFHDTYWDVTGCGNTVNAGNPFALRLILDSLRYWVTEMHVDGFRFDLMSALARVHHRIDMDNHLLMGIGQDPVLRHVKLIAEPWDASMDGYRVGEFPPPWVEWNDQYRDEIRDFWRNHSAGIRSVATRLAGSSDLYLDDGRSPYAPINFVTAHDGFTVRDLVTYEHKRNKANGEDNRDGTDNNRSWNHGVEGETDDPQINALRRRQQRNFLATLLLSLGTPMILGGDEFGRTQGGNNNAWCQDNEISWFDWELDDDGHELQAFTRRLIALRRSHPAFRRTRFLRGRSEDSGGLPDVWWFRPDGRRMTKRDWERPDAHVLGVFLNGDELQEVTREGEPVSDASFLLLFNASHEDVEFRLPNERFGRRWVVEMTTADTEERQRGKEQEALGPVLVMSRSLLLMRRVDGQ